MFFVVDSTKTVQTQNLGMIKKVKNLIIFYTLILKRDDVNFFQYFSDLNRILNARNLNQSEFRIKINFQIQFL